MGSIDKGISKAQFWGNHIANWEAGDLSQEKYCAQKNVGYSAFVYWRMRLLKAKKAKKPAKFKAVQVRSSSSVQPQMKQCFTVILPNQTKIILSADMPTTDLKNIFQAIGAVS